MPLGLRLAGCRRFVAAMVLAGAAQAEPSLTVTDRDSRFILAAPHGHYDRHTGDIVDAVCGRVGWNCLVARGFRTDRDPLNVNRPTEGVGLAPREERHTDRAARVFDRYRAAWQALGGADAALYVEVHGNSRAESAGRLEVAVVGIAGDALAALECLLASALARAGLDALEPWVEGRRRIWFRARSTKWYGILSDTPHALHLEFPRRVRDAPHRARVITFLTDALPTLERWASKNRGQRNISSGRIKDCEG